MIRKRIRFNGQLRCAGAVLAEQCQPGNTNALRDHLIRLMNVLANELPPSGIAYILQVPVGDVVDHPGDATAAEAAERELDAIGALGSGRDEYGSLD